MDKLSGKQNNITKDRPSKKISMDCRVKHAIQKLQGEDGISLQGLKKYLRDEKNMDVAALNDEIKLALKAGIDKGLLVREGGNYKVRAAARRRRSKSKGGRSRSRKRSKGRKRSKSRGKSRRRSRRRKKAAAADEM